MMEVEFEVLNMDSWINVISSKHLCSVTIIDCIPWNGMGGQAKFQVGGNASGSVLDDIRSQPDICSLEAEVIKDEGIIGTIGMKNCQLIRTIIGSGCFFEWARSDGDGKVRFHITAGSDGSISSLMKELDGMGLVVEIRRLVRSKAAAPMSFRQEQVVRLALEEGYYEMPRRITIKEIAARFHASPSSVRETLLRAERNAIEQYLSKRA